jgi:hypothetical protein
VVAHLQVDDVLLRVKEVDLTLVTDTLIRDADQLGIEFRDPAIHATTKWSPPGAVRYLATSTAFSSLSFMPLSAARSASRYVLC